MIPEKELEQFLRSRLKPSLPPEQIEELLGEIKALGEGWEEVNIAHRDMGYSMSVNCPDICWLADQVYHGAVIRMYRKNRAQAA